MKKSISCKCLLFVLCTVLLFLICFPSYASAADVQSESNRFNIVFVLDASNSINYTDENNLRFEAIELFSNLLAEEGNTLGGVVFSNGIDAEQPLQRISSQTDKDAVTSIFRSVVPVGYTNIGEALKRAVELIKENGSQDLPSVIVFLSDGNTEMPTDDELVESLEKKADALYEARKNDIQIYTVCLNANGRADTSEMEQISSATGGVFEEVSSAEDLQDVFNAFYNLIYGTSTITLADDVFTPDGTLSTPFQVPGIGVEEVNIIIAGKPHDISLVSPNGSTPNVSQVSSELCTFLKMKDVVPGNWTLNTVGVPGDSVKINMVYNVNLEVEATTDVEQVQIYEHQPFKVIAILKSGSVLANSKEQYTGYEAELNVMNAYHELIKTVPMITSGNGFEAELSLSEGAYFCSASIRGNYIEKTSNELGPIAVAIQPKQEVEPKEIPVNTPPKPIKDSVSKTVYILPFMPANLNVDLKSLATDTDGDSLQYKVVSSSFIENEDYTVSNDILTMNHFSLFKGSYDIQATDPKGESCTIELVVTSVNVGLIALILLGVAALVAIAVFGVLLYIAFTKPFRGTISVQSYCDGVARGTPRSPKRGRCKLSVFGLDPIGLDYTKSYFQATGQPYIYLITNVPVMWNGQKSSKVRIQSGAQTNISLNSDESRVLEIRFSSRMNGRPVAKPRPRAPRARR